MSSEIDTVKKDLENGVANAEKAYRAQLMAAKQPAIVALQKELITQEQYAELVGETFADTMRAQYEVWVASAAESVRYRVSSGLLTEDEYNAIVQG